MDLGLTEDQEMLQKVAADFVKAEVPAHQMTQWFLNKKIFRPEIIKKAAELGWLGMMLPEEFGGAALSTMDCAVGFSVSSTIRGFSPHARTRQAKRTRSLAPIVNGSSATSPTVSMHCKTVLRAPMPCWNLR